MAEMDLDAEIVAIRELMRSGYGNGQTHENLPIRIEISETMKVDPLTGAASMTDTMKLYRKAGKRWVQVGPMLVQSRESALRMLAHLVEPE